MAADRQPAPGANGFARPPAFLLGLAAGVLACGCLGCVPRAPSVPAAAPAAQPPPQAAVPAAPQPPPAEVPAAHPSPPAEVPLRLVRRTQAGITLEGVEFDARRYRLVVADQEDGPGSQWPDAQSAARSHGGLAAINAGFFTPEGQPLGLVVSSGKRTGAWHTSSLASGLWHETSQGALALGRSNAARLPAGARELIQSGPFLVERGRPTAGLDDAKPAIRSLILWDGGQRWWIGRSSACTLAALSRALASRSPAGWPVQDALNLDGGRSSDLWISSAVAGGPLLRRAAWNRPVRNFLVVVPR